MKRLVVLDTETTGLSPQEGHRLIEIGCIELIDRKVTNNHFHTYINPERAVDKEAFAVHGLADKFLADKPLFHEVADSFLNYIEGAEVIIHNAPFDVAFLDAELSKQKKGKFSKYCTVFDTLVLARKMHMGQRNSLDALCKRYSIDNKHRKFHGALLDATLLAEVYLAMTGGQISFFEEDSAASQSFVGSFKSVSHQESRVIRASAQELSEHKERLAALAKQGKCLWPDA